MNFYLRLRAKARRLAETRRRERDEFMRRLGRDPKPPPKKPPEAGIAVPAIPPKGPLPLQGGAEAPLDFSD